MKILVVAPHPDDEVLGLGGTLLRSKNEGNVVAWMIATEMKKEFNWSDSQIVKRELEIQKISEFFKFDEVYRLGFPTARLDTVAMNAIVQSVADVIKIYEPNIVYLPHGGDVHTDHKILNAAVLSCVKSFRYPSIRRILSYETMSETEHELGGSVGFKPNVFIDISSYLGFKIKAMEIYESEVGDFPFPRSKIAIESLAKYRGSAVGFEAAEAFELLRERVY